MATLKDLVNETTNIKNELVECYNNLKNFLSSKGISISSSDKMSNLINIVKTFKYQTDIPFSGTDVLLYHYPDEFSNAGASKLKMCEYLYNGSSGILRFSIDIGASSTSGVRVYVKVVRNGNETEALYFYHKNTDYVEYIGDIDVLDGDVITVWTDKVYNGYICYTKNVKITCNYMVI